MDYYLQNNDNHKTLDIIIDNEKGMYIINIDKFIYSDYLPSYKSIVRYIEENNIQIFDHINNYRYKFEVSNATYRTSSFFYIDNKKQTRGINKNGKMFSVYPYLNKIVDTTLDKNFKLLDEL